MHSVGYVRSAIVNNKIKKKKQKKKKNFNTLILNNTNLTNCQGRSRYSPTFQNEGRQGAQGREALRRPVYKVLFQLGEQGGAGLLTGGSHPLPPLDTTLLIGIANKGENDDYKNH